MMTGYNNVLLVLTLFIIVFSHLHFDFAASSSSSCRETEWKALMDFKGSLVDELNQLSSWKGRDCCSWFGITCHNHTGYVQMIELNDLGGRINPSLLHLEHLEHLDLSYNKFSGIRIPPFLGNLRSLKYLALSDAGFIGEIPQHLGNLSNLQHLSLGDYDPLSKKLSSMSLNWITRLSYLTNLELYNIDASESIGWLDSINMHPSMSSLSLVDCGLVGMTLSRDLNLTSLVSIDLSDNDFNSSLHPSFFNLSSLEDIKIDASKLQGPIPNMFQKLTSLNRLDLSRMSLSSPIPDSVCTLTSLTHLHLSDLELQGSIPFCLGNLTNITLLKLAGNKLSGEIPSELGSLTRLIDLDLSDNQLSGRIPSNLGKRGELQRLDVSKNSLMGEISESFFEGLKSLKSLDISKNHHMVFNVSSQWIPPFQLGDLDMDSIFIGIKPPFPVWLRSQTNLYSLSLRNTSLSGVIPDWCQTSYPQLDTFDLSNNFLTGPIPTFNVINKATLTYLELSNNQFIGKIPDELCNLRSMGFLKLANNHLIGSIPPCMGNLRELGALDLANNSLSGHIPYELGYLNQLYVLYLNGNMLSGELPSSLQNLTHLNTLNLGENALQGSIPNWIGKEFKHLEHLILQSNNFSGEIPQSLCLLTSLMILILPDNSLVGTIPSCLGNLSMTPFIIYSDSHLSIISKGIELDYISSNLFYAKLISLSGNQLHGNIPDELMDLIDLQSLNLSNNKLTGNIPERIGNMKHLESLDLSRNNLLGIIPQSLAYIDDLGYLNLSFNNFSGKIPSGGHFDTFDDPYIYEGNEELCGKPVKGCDGDIVSSKQKRLVSDGDDDSGIEFDWFYAGIGPGFAVGLLGVLCILFFKVHGDIGTLDLWKMCTIDSRVVC